MSMTENRSAKANQRAKKMKDKCGACKKQKQEWQCETCNIDMCDDCKTAHASFPVTQDHDVLPLETSKQPESGKQC